MSCTRCVGDLNQLRLTRLRRILSRRYRHHISAQCNTLGRRRRQANLPGPTDHLELVDRRLLWHSNVKMKEEPHSFVMDFRHSPTMSMDLASLGRGLYLEQSQLTTGRHCRQAQLQAVG